MDPAIAPLLLFAFVAAMAGTRGELPHPPPPRPWSPGTAPVDPPSGGDARRSDAIVEQPGVAHLRPDARLAVRQQLPDVIAVVVDPLAQEVADPQLADPWVDPGAI